MYLVRSGNKEGPFEDSDSHQKQFGA